MTDTKILFDEMPLTWQKWPCQIVVAFTLTPITCVYRALYEEYERSNCQEVAETIFDPKNTDIFVHYQVKAAGFAPAFAWYVSWPLFKRGGSEGFKPRSTICVGAPWEYVADNTLFEVWNKPNGVYGSTRTIMLRAGGRSKDDATQNWQSCAKPFRKIAKAMRSGGKS